MANWIHRTTKQVLVSVSPASLPELRINYIEQPDLSAVAGQPVKYWVITGNVVSIADASTRTSIDAAEDSAGLDSIADELDQVQTIMRAFAEVVLDEFNNLRGQHSLPSRTLAQLKTAVRGKL